MTPWAEVIQSPVIHRIGWTLLHFLWEGAALAAVWAGVRWLLRRHEARVRYLAACGVFLLLAAAPVVTFVMLSAGGASVVTEIGAAFRPAGMEGTGTTHGTGLGNLPLAADRFAAILEGQMGWLVALWVAGVGVLSLRLVRGYWTVRQLASRDTVPAGVEWSGRLRELQRRLGMSRPVRVLISAVVEIPTVIGWLRPVILVPASSLSGLTPAQLELILAHELAHIRRYDHWVNLAQVLVETLWFYHPAVWWISAGLRLERELCCDDLAVEACGDRLAYARALTALETLRHSPAALALGAGGGSLLQRIRHVMGLGAVPGAGRARQTLANALIGAGLVLLALGLACLAVSPRDYVAVCKLLPRDEGSGLAESATPMTHRTFDPYFIQTEFEKLGSRAVLLDVAQRLRLTEKWKGGGERLTVEEAAAQLRGRLSLRQVPRSSLIEVRVRGNGPEEAAELANGVAQSYREQRLSAHAEGSHRGLDQLKEETRAQEARVQELQIRLDDLRQNLRVPAGLSERTDLARYALDPETVRRLEGERISAEAQRSGMVELLGQLKALRARGEADLIQALPSAYPDSDLSKLLQDLWGTEAQLAKLNTMHGKEHPEIQALAAMRADLDQKVHGRVEGVLSGLEVRIAAKEAELTSLREAVASGQQRDAEMAEKYRPYFAARSDLEDAQKIRDAMLLRTLQETVDSALPLRSVEVIEQATPSGRAVARWGRLGLNLCGAGLLSAMAGLVLRLVRPRATPLPAPA